MPHARDSKLIALVDRLGPVPAPGTVKARVTNLVVKLHVEIYRTSRGKLFGEHSGVPFLLLDHTGRKTGKKRTVALAYLRDGENIVVVASRGGSDAMPAWWLNLLANPETTVQVGSVRRRVAVRQATPGEKSQLWPRLVEMYPGYATYQERTEREIPLGILSPVRD